MLKMGFMISLSGLITLGASYILRIYISNTGGVNDVGLYNAGFAILIHMLDWYCFAAFTDLYPRLASVANNNDLCKNTINQQAEIAILILAPIIIAFIVFANWAVILLYSNKFTPINDMILWAALGMFLKRLVGSLLLSF